LRTSPPIPRLITTEVNALPLDPNADLPSRVSARRGVKHAVVPFLLFLVALLAFRSVVFDWNHVPTGSMAPTIAVGDHIAVDKRAYDIRLPFTQISLWRRAEPGRGDIVAFRSPVEDRLYVKRVIAVPGDQVALRGDVLVINGRAARFAAIDSGNGAENNRQQIEEDIGGHRHLIALSGAHTEPGFELLTVPPGAYLMMGDNRHESFDSRHFGFVERSRIIGKATSVVFSLDYENAFLPRPGRILTALR